MRSVVSLLLFVLAAFAVPATLEASLEAPREAPVETRTSAELAEDVKLETALVERAPTSAEADRVGLESGPVLSALRATPPTRPPR